MRGRFRLVFTLFTLLAPALAAAQQAARLTLAEALQLADKQNLDLAAARQRRAVSLAGVQIARQRPNPTFSFTALRDEPHQGLFFDQSIETAGKRHHRIDVAKQEGALTDVEISTLAHQVRHDTRNAYYQLAFAHADADRLGEVLKLAERLKQIAADRYQAGAVAELEVIQADLEVARAQAEFTVAQEEEKVALSELNALLNEPAETSWDLAGSLYDLPPSVLLPNLIERAYGSNPDLEHVAQEQKVEASRHEMLKAERVPNLDLQFGTDFNSPHDFRVGPRSQVAIVLPLFYRNQGELAQSVANERLLNAEQAATRRSVAGRVETAYYDWHTRQTQVEIYQKTLLPAARKLEGLAEESYRAGKTNILAVIDAQRNVQDVEHSYLQSLLALESAYAALEQTVGAPLD